jgi:type VI secretion system protein VasI
MAKLDTCEGEVFLVDSIEGTNSLSDLLKLITNSSVASVTSEKSPTEATAPEMSDPVWTWIVTEDKSKIDDSTNVTLMLFANEEVYNSFGSADRPTLVIRCKENTTEAYVMTGNMLDNENAIIRLDSEKAYPLKMSKSTDGKALFFPSVITNIKKFWNYETMVFRFTPYNSGSSTVTFNIGGLKTEIARLRKACQW